MTATGILREWWDPETVGRARDDGRFGRNPTTGGACGDGAAH